MSAYGKITRSTNFPPPTLHPRSFPLASQSSSSKRLTVFPVRRDTVPQELIIYLQGVFNDVVEEGRTYPQMGKQSFEEFAGYFLGGDCFLGLLDESAYTSEVPEGGVYREELKLEDVRAGREWKDAVLGMYYIKPNYPGRSSHNCNGGFVVPSIHRGLKVGKTLGRSYLHYAPLLGYKGSVFNLVYVNNIASVKIWDSLGFTRAGLIPNAGLLKKAEGGEGEEYVDAIVFHYNFMQAK